MKDFIVELLKLNLFPVYFFDNPIVKVSIYVLVVNLVFGVFNYLYRSYVHF